MNEPTVDIVFRWLTVGSPDSEAAKLMAKTGEFGARRLVQTSRETAALLAAPGALVATLRALEAEWRRRHDAEQDYYYNGLWEACADELATALAAHSDVVPRSGDGAGDPP